MQELQGRLHEAERCYRQTLDAATETGVQHIPFVGMAQVGIGRLLYEWNDLDGATHHLTTAIEAGQEQGEMLTGPGWHMLATGYLGLARVLLARGDPDGALELIQRAEALAREHDPSQIPRIAAARVRLWLALGNLDAAMRWAHECGLDANDEPTYPREPEHLALARVLTAVGKSKEAGR